MSSLKQIKEAKQAVLRQQAVVHDLETLVKSIERCEKTILDLQAELVAVNSKHQDRKTTQQDIAYLNDLLRCAHQKLSWEKQVASLQKRVPVLLERIGALNNDPKHPPDEAMRGAMVRALQAVQAAMEKLQQVKVT
ncbi:MAG: hypothetical protein AB1813_10485 [Verrucomicrobiota bacterium]